MNFFFDANVSPRISKILAVLNEKEHEITHIPEHPLFTQNNNQYGNSTTDIEVIETLSKENNRWSVVSGDINIINTAHERAALIKSGLSFFALDKNWGKAGVMEQAWKIIKIWNDIVRHASARQPGMHTVHMGKRQYVEVVRPGKRARGGDSRG
jgi:hypothetical protein